MLMGGKERIVVFDTGTGMDDKSLIKAIKISARRAAKIALSQDHSNVNAIRLLKWTKDKNALEPPNVEDYMKTYKAAGLETYSALSISSEGNPDHEISVIPITEY